MTRKLGDRQAGRFKCTKSHVIVTASQRFECSFLKHPEAPSPDANPSGGVEMSCRAPCADPDRLRVAADNQPDVQLGKWQPTILQGRR